MTEATKYTLYGLFFGCFFPVFSLVILGLTDDLVWADGLIDAIWQAHRSNPLLCVIDTAPLVTALVARFAGIRQDRILQFSASLEQQVAEKTKSLQRTLEEMQKANELIVYMAEHDALTGLLNRRRFQNELEQWVSYAHRYDRHFALMFVDLDNLKAVNDRYGHGAGDEYLRVVAQLLQEVFRASDKLARWGGDEFAILLPDTDAEMVTETASRLLDRFTGKVIEFEKHQWKVSGSIGIALFPVHATNARQLMIFADSAMYAAKKRGGNCLHVYSDGAQ